jgi:hypothetical protein
MDRWMAWIWFPVFLINFFVFRGEFSLRLRVSAVNKTVFYDYSIILCKNNLKILESRLIVETSLKPLDKKSMVSGYVG